MLKRMKLIMVVLAALAFQLAVVPSASAHGVTVTATASCDPTGSTVISYTATSWFAGFGGANPQINILFNGVVVDTGAFSSPAFSFSGSKPAPPGQTVIVTALVVGAWDDGAAGGQSQSDGVDVPADCVQAGTGRFTGGGSQITVGGVKVTRGLTIHCDLLLSNNLEVNWGGNQFHMEEHITTVSCTDDPNIVQAPPAAPLDTLVGIGIGRYNNSDGFTIEFTLVDAGEPGTIDKMAIRIYETANPANVVLNVPLQYLTGGNLQAHYDQPHKK